MINEALRLLRLYHDMTQRELAERLQISKSHLSEVEAGKKTPTLPLLERYAETFDVPVSSILFFAENINERPSPARSRTLVAKKVLALMNFIAERSGRTDELERVDAT